jgi:hypothetical protein
MNRIPFLPRVADREGREERNVNHSPRTYAQEDRGIRHAKAKLAQSPVALCEGHNQHQVHRLPNVSPAICLLLLSNHKTIIFP